MRKIFISIIVCSFVFLSAYKNVNATSTIDGSYEVDIIDALENPEKYPNASVKKYNSTEFKEVIKNDRNMSEEAKNEILQEISQNDKLRAGAYDYINLTAKCKVTDNYYCQPYFYAYTYFGGPSHEPSKIAKILNANIDRNYYGTSKQFSGDLYYNLESERCIYWDVNGDFYNNGTTSVGLGGQIGIGEDTHVSFSVSSSSNHYSYCNQHGRFRI